MKHLKEQPFVVATALSALIHSTWALGVLFAGHPPAFEVTFWYVLELVYWLIPALLIAIALDVGQVSTATSIRRRPTAAKYVTFGVFAVATYYLQWNYMLYHMPDLTPSSGIAQSQVWLIEPLRNLALWIIPSLLPLSTTLYTLSSDSDDESKTPHLVLDEAHIVTEQNIQSPIIVHQEPVAVDLLQYKTDNEAELLQYKAVDTAPEYTARCADCAWEKSGYASQTNANRALNIHRRTCPTLHPELQVMPTYGNGNGEKQQ